MSRGINKEFIVDTINLSNLNVVYVECSAWSGGTSLRKEDLKLDSLPDRAFSLGRKYLIAPEKLTCFPTMRRRARERCLKLGTRFIGGFAQPQDEASMVSLVGDLEDIQTEYYSKVADLLADLDSSVDAWVSEEEVKPYEALIRASIPTKKSIERKFKFAFTIFKVGDPVNAPAGLLKNEVGALPATLLGEIAESAKGLADSFLTRCARMGVEKEEWSFNRKTATAVDGLKCKLKGLQFLAPEIPPVVDEIERIISMIPENGSIEGDGMKRLYSLLLILSDEDRMRSLGKGLLNCEQIASQEFPVPAVTDRLEATTSPDPDAQPQIPVEGEDEPLFDEDDAPEIRVSNAPSLFRQNVSIAF